MVTLMWDEIRWDGLLEGLYSIYYGYTNMLCALFAVIVLYYLWRLWTFTIDPSLHHNEPRPLPYWIPCESRQISWQPS